MKKIGGGVEVYADKVEASDGRKGAMKKGVEADVGGVVCVIVGRFEAASTRRTGGGRSSLRTDKLPTIACSNVTLLS